MDATERFRAAAAGLGVEVEPREYPAGTRTAADAAAAIGCEIDQIVKSLVFVAIGEDEEEEAVLALTAGGNRVDEAGLAAVHGVPTVRRADADEVRAATGFAIGGTPPFGHVRGLATYLDPRLAEQPELWAAAGTARTVFRCTPGDLVSAGAVVAAGFAT